MDQDELSALLSRNLTFSQPPPAPTPAPVQAQAPVEEPKIVYISQHYTHSAHVARNDAQPPARHHTRAASEPPQPDHSAAQAILIAHGVDPSGLSSAQLSLFTRVEDSEKGYLVNLWGTYPPSRNDNPTFGWSMTSMSLEESLALERCQRLDSRRQGEGVVVMSLDGTPLTPVHAGPEHSMDIYSDSEPYMISGFEELAQQVPPGGSDASKERPLSFSAAPVTSAFNPAHSDPVYNMDTMWCSRAMARWG
ncbi:hypothetical protein B0T18DRAFT_76358 [Schizothecium vesticola]|uniref:Uncharacterized protein n=1 Tax=Schizothecium vesticola TaxID=314040 RepID=A0AA40F5V2_9PEZI|nr:hypothetical protein B0T18DRAFT_76358 [Schizothecium vesticola]